MQRLWDAGDATSGALAALARGYAHLLPQPAEVRFFEVDVPDVLLRRAGTDWSPRRLGYTLPPLAKVDGAARDVPVRGDEDEADLPWLEPGGLRPARVDGVWDFRAEFGCLLVHSPGHDAIFHDGSLLGVLAGPGADVAGLGAWLDDEAHRVATAARELVGLGGTDGETGLRVDPAGVVLPEELRSDLLRDLELFCTDRAWYQAERVPWRRGLLLYGPPGNGKTTVARMLASRALDLGAGAFAYTPSREHHDGVLRRVFARASRRPPAVLILEDLDAVRGTQITRAVLLGLLEDRQTGAGLFVVATTNYPDEVDPALAGRAGRFDRAVHLPNPDAALRRRYLQRLWSGRALAARVEDAVAATDGLSLASLNEVHYHLAMRLRDGRPADGDAVAAIAAALRRVEAAKRSGRWEEQEMGFRRARR